MDTGFALRRIGVKGYTSHQLQSINERKFICVAVTVIAKDEAEARALAATPRTLPKGAKVLPDNTIDPPPPYAWCVDEDPAAWLDPTKTSCTPFQTRGSHHEKSHVLDRQFQEVPLYLDGAP